VRGGAVTRRILTIVPLSRTQQHSERNRKGGFHGVAGDGRDCGDEWVLEKRESNGLNEWETGRMNLRGRKGRVGKD